MFNFNGPIFKLIDAIANSDWIEAIIYLALIVIVLLFAFPLHELFHALAADRLGDNTARQMGRITLNPLKQLNMWGSVLFLTLGFGWASVPVNYANFGENWRQKAALVALAGPAANLLLAIVFTGIYYLLNFLSLETLSPTPALIVVVAQSVMMIGVSINCFLLIFNLLPIPPLDGARAFITLLPASVEPIFAQAQQFSFIILIVLAQTSLFNVLVDQPAGVMSNWLLRLAS